MLLKASSGECCAPRNFLLRRYTCSPHRVPQHVPNEIDYVKINVETNLSTAVSTRMTSLDVPMVPSLLRLKRFYTSSKYFIVELGDVFLAAFTRRDQSTNYKTC